MACCSNCTQRSCSVILILLGFYNLIFLILVTFIFKLSLRNSHVTELKETIYPGTPIYGLTFIYPYTSNYRMINSFYDWGGSRGTQASSPKNITKIYSKQFYYLKDEKSFIEYSKKYSVSNGENCKDNYKKCGILNTEGRILCLPNKEDCPLNDFVISEVDNDPNYSSYQKYAAGNSKYFYYTNKKTDNPIIVDLKLSKGLPCMSPKEKSWFKVSNDEIEKDDALECKTSINGKTTDDRYIKIEHDISLGNLYADNDIPFTTSSDIVNLYKRNYIYSKNDCINDFLGNKSNGAEITIKVLGAISSVLVVALIIYCFTIRCCFVDYHFIWVIVPIFGILFNIIALLVNYTIKPKYECDEEYKDLINGFLDYDLKFFRSTNIIYCIISLITSIITLLILICMRSMKKLQVYDRSTGRMVQVQMIPQNQQVYAQQYQMNMVAYPQNVPYYNVAQNNNSQNLNFNANQMNYNPNSKNNFNGY